MVVKFVSLVIVQNLCVMYVKMHVLRFVFVATAELWRNINDITFGFARLRVDHRTVSNVGILTRTQTLQRASSLTYNWRRNMNDSARAVIRVDTTGKFSERVQSFNVELQRIRH